MLQELFSKIQENAEKKFLEPPPNVTYKGSPNLHDLLVRSQLHDHKVKPPPGSDIHKCHHPRCLTCPFLQDGQTKYTFSATKEERNIPGTLNCKSRNLIYLIRCKKNAKQKNKKKNSTLGSSLVAKALFLEKSLC